MTNEPSAKDGKRVIAIREGVYRRLKKLGDENGMTVGQVLDAAIANMLPNDGKNHVG